ncbi:MAG: 1-deoxy-D-xylulose-5-phosphate reductoisomerase [Treponema sp.]|jgi:1-deoxy-D-xylulose-5-phosphate reductoisomerase|nr:1-deoxy-D-xylulose-5-phosphate reductoisomerase [Treponema sp.]
MKKRVAVLGATGSIGTSALDVIAREKDNFEIVLLSARRNGGALAGLGRQWPGALTVLGTENGAERLLAAIAASGADITLNGISGSAGLAPSMAALESGSDLALANKETLVMAGPLVLRKAREKKANIIPVDSEHSAIFNLIEAHGYDALDEIILTASGGPFRNYSAGEMEKVGPQAALAHPTWSMGPKITIDSASMANKGLEVIEAAMLFALPVGLPYGQPFPPEKIKVVIHPQSVIHSMIRMKDGAVYAQLSHPDMRLPIYKALHWPRSSSSDEDASSKETASSGFGRLDFDSLSLEFYPPDTEKFPMLAFAYEAVKKGGLYPCAYNGANEAAVSAFLAGRIGFLDIARVTGYVLEREWSAEPEDLAAVMEADRRAKIMAEEELRCY